MYGEETIEELVARISELEEENANLRLLDQTIRRNNALFHALLANSSQGITMTGPDRRIVRVVRGLSGLDPDGLSGELVESVVAPEDREAVLEAYRKLLGRSCTKVRLDVRVPRPDGSMAHLSATVTDMLDDPNVQCIVWNYCQSTGP